MSVPGWRSHGEPSFQPIKIGRDGGSRSFHNNLQGGYREYKHIMKPRNSFAGDDPTFLALPGEEVVSDAGNGLIALDQICHPSVVAPASICPGSIWL